MQSIENNIRKDTMFFQKIPVFEYHIEYPSFRSDCNQRNAEKINDFYIALADRKERYCKLVLYPQAVEAARYVQGNNPPFNYYQFYMSYKIMLNKECTVSLYMEEYTFMGGAHGSTIRTSDTWNFRTGKRVYLKDLYGDDPLLKERILKSIRQQISERSKASPETFFDNSAKLAQDTLNLNSFYLTPEGSVIYFQQYDIAPYAAGFPEFLLSGI